MRTILVIREYDVFSRILAESNFEIVSLSLIETKVSDELSDFETKLAAIENFDGIFVTSRRAAQILAETLREKKIDFSGKVYVLGKRGFEILKTENLDLFYKESANTAREMLDAIPLAELRKKRFLFVRGEKSLRVVPDFLEKIASIEEAIVYRTDKIAVEIDEINRLREKLEAGEIAAACFFSPSAAESFLEQFGEEITHQTIIATIGKMTAEYFERRNVKVAFVSSKSNAENFAIELTNFLNKRI